jgi:hypothetical protein
LSLLTRADRASGEASCRRLGKLENTTIGEAMMKKLGAMLAGLAQSDIEVVSPLPIEFSQAAPTISRPSEAMQWLNAHHIHSPVTRDFHPCHPRHQAFSSRANASSLRPRRV